MESTTIENIRKLARKDPDCFYFTEHAYDEIFRGNISFESVMETILKGTVHKKEPDEQTCGKLWKYVIVWRDYYIAVKNDKPPVILSVRRNK